MRSKRSIELNGNTILALRERWGLTQAAFGRLLGFSREWVARAERPGTGAITKKAIERIADLTGTPSDLVLDVLLRHSAWIRTELAGERQEGAKALAEWHGPVLLPGLRDDRAQFDQNFEPYSRIELMEPPTFNLSVAAGPWVGVYELGELTDHERKLIKDQRLFRISLRGDSMEKEYPDGSLVEFKQLDRIRDAITVGADYYVQKADATATFKRVEAVDDEHIVLRAINRKRYPKPMPVALAEITNMARAEYVLKKIGG